MLCLHILQSSLGFINTLMIQDTLAEPEWAGKLTDADRRGLTPLFPANMTPYGEIQLQPRPPPGPGRRQQSRPGAQGLTYRPSTIVDVYWPFTSFSRGASVRNCRPTAICRPVTRIGTGS